MTLSGTALHRRPMRQKGNVRECDSPITKVTTAVIHADIPTVSKALLLYLQGFTFVSAGASASEQPILEIVDETLYVG